MMKLLLSLLIFAASLPAAFDEHAYRFRRVVQTARTPLAAVLVDGTVYRSSLADLRDLRLLAAGREVPYVLKTSSGSQGEKDLTPSLIDKVVVPHLGVQAVLDIGQKGPHNRVTVVTGRTNFRQTLRVETSEDGRNWDVVRRDGMIFDVSTPDQHARGLSVSYPPSTRRFVRITIEGWKDPDALASATVSSLQDTAAKRDVIADLHPAVTQEAQAHVTVLHFDLQFARPYDRIALSIAPGLFSRTAEVSTSCDGKAWFTAGAGTLSRTQGEERLVLAFPEQWKRYVRVRISNEDNAPLKVLSGRFEELQRELIFRSEAAGPYLLYSGNTGADEPRYDLGSVLPMNFAEVSAVLGPIEPNPDYHAPKPPVSERSPWLLNALLLLLAPLAAWFAFRLLKQVKANET